MTQTNFNVTSENGSSSDDLSGLDNVLRSIDVGGSNAAANTSFTINVDGPIHLATGSAVLPLDSLAESGNLITVTIVLARTTECPELALHERARARA